MTSTIYIIEQPINAKLQQLEIAKQAVVIAQQGSVYSLIDAQTGMFPNNVQLQQDKNNLLVVRNGEVLLVIEGYFDELKDVSFDDTGSMFADLDIDELNTEFLDNDPVWSAETDTIITVSDKVSNQSADSNTNNTEVSSSPDTANPEVSSAQTSIESDIIQGTDQAATASTSTAGGLGWGWYAAGALGAAAIGSGGGSSSSDTGVGSGGSASTSSTTISAAAGIFFSTVEIVLYDQNGAEFSREEHTFGRDADYKDYVYTGSYSGPMLVEINDINGQDGDYIDETTGDEKSLGTTSLRAMTNTDGSDQAISVTPLTELATQLAGVTAENRAVSTEKVELNSKVATLFGLGDILTKPAVITEDTSSADAAAKKYGEALAILSGADSAEGTSAADTIVTIANSLREANADNSADLKLTSEVANILTKGLEAFNDGPIGRDKAIESTFTFSSVPVLVDGYGNVLKVINANAVADDATIQVKIKGVSAGQVVTLTVGDDTFDYTVSDVVSGHAYVPIDSERFYPDGNYDVVVKVNESAPATTTIRVDTTPPDAPTFKLHQDTGDSDSDGVTSDTTVDVTLASGITNWQYSLDGGVTWITRTSGSSFELKGGTKDGNTIYEVGDIQVRQLDSAGNESDVFSNASPIETLPTLAPELSVEDTGISNSDGITNSTTVSVTFDEDVEQASWQYSVDGGATWSDGTGKTFELAENKTYQADTIQVKQIDTDGNEEIGTLSSKIVTDTTVSAPVIFLATDSGQSTSDGITNVTTYRVMLAIDVASWEYSVDSGANWVTGSGTSFELNENQTYAAGSIQVRQTDDAGNVSDIRQNTIAITTDTIAPVAPSASLQNDTGASADDGITNDTRVNVTLSDDAVSWQYSLDGGTTWSASQATSVTTFELADNTTYAIGSLQVRQYDAAGNVSAVDSNDQIITLDSLVSVPALTFSLTSNDLTSTSVTVTLEDDVASWEYSLDGGSTWKPGQGERFSLEPLTAYGANTIQVRQTDIAGNISDIAANEALETDVAIDPPSFTLASDTGVSDEDFITSATTVNVTLLEGAEGAVSWKYSLDGGLTWSEVQPASTTSFELADNTTYEIGQIRVTQTDVEGNESAYATNDSAVIIDSVVDAPEFSIIDTGISATDGITNNLTINVNLADDVASWEYKLKDGEWQAGEYASFELVANETYAVGEIQVKQTDLAGNESIVFQNSSQIITDTTPLDAPSFSLNSDSGVSATDNITNDTTVNVVLAGDAASWEYSLNNGSTWLTGEGTSFELAENVTYAAGDIQVRQTDVAGNVSTPSLNDSVIITDTIADAPSLSLRSDSGKSDSDGITNDVVVKVDLSEDTAHWEYSLDSGETWIQGSGSSFELNANQAYAMDTIQVRQTDLAGNLSAVGFNSMDIITDTIPLAAPSFALADTSASDNDFITSDTTINVTLDSEAASWEYSLDSGATWKEGSGASFEMGGLQTYAIGQIQVRQLDLAGNVSEVSANEVVFVTDSLPAPIVELANDTGRYDDDGVTSDTQVNVTLSDGAVRWEYSLDSGSTWLTGEGTSFQVAANVTYEVDSIQVKQFDAENNVSAIFSNDGVLITDTIAPSADDISIDVSNSIQVQFDNSLGAYNVDVHTVGDNAFVMTKITNKNDSQNNHSFFQKPTLTVQPLTSDGVNGLPYVFELDSDFDYFSVEDVVRLGNEGHFAVTWIGEDTKSNDDSVQLYFQLFDAAGQRIGDVQVSPGSLSWGYDSALYALDSANQYLLAYTKEISGTIEAQLQLIDAATGEAGTLLAFGEGSVAPYVMPIGDSGNFIAVWNQVVDLETSSAIVKAQTYTADGVSVGDILTLNSEAGAYTDAVALLGSDGAFVAMLTNETEKKLSLQIVKEDGVMSRVELGEYFGDAEDPEFSLSSSNSEGEFAVVWAGVNEEGESTIYSQSFNRDGALQSEPLVLPFEFNSGANYEFNFDVESADPTQGYFVSFASYKEVDPREYNYRWDYDSSGVYFVSGDTVTPIVSQQKTDGWAVFDVRVLNDAGDTLIVKQGSGSGNNGWMQIFNADGTEKTEQIPFASNANNLRSERLNSDGDFLISWTEWGGYIDNESSQWVNQVTHHIQLFSADGTSITPIEIEPGDDLPVSFAEEGVAYLVSSDVNITTLSDILALEDGTWSRVDVSADTESVLSTDGLAEGEYFVYVSDLAGNIAQNTSLVTISSSSQLLEGPDVKSNEDTGKYDNDAVTNDPQVNVTLTDGAVRWEYSVDHGFTWVEGEGTSFNLADNTTYGYYDIQVRQYDEAGNVSRIASNDSLVVIDTFVSEPHIEIIGNTAFVTLDDDINEWYYSLVGGGENESNWHRGSGDSFLLEPNTTYNPGDIVVYVEDMAGNEAKFTYNQTVTTGEAYGAPSFTLFADTGLSNTDGVTYDGWLNVFLSDDAVAYEYSLDGGQSWQHGAGAYILLGEGESILTKDFVAFQYDADGKETRLQESSSKDGEDADEYIQFAMGFLLSEGTVSWKYSKDGGETFTTATLADADGNFIDLEYGTEYPAGEILVRQINAAGELSLTATNEQAYIIDGRRPDLFNFNQLEVEVLSQNTSIESISIDGNGSFISLSNDFASNSIYYQFHNAGGALTEAKKIDLQWSHQGIDVSVVSDSGHLVLSYNEFVDNVSQSTSVLFDSAGNVIQTLTGIPQNQNSPSQAIPVGGEGNFIVYNVGTANVYSESGAFIKSFAIPHGATVKPSGVDGDIFVVSGTFSNGSYAARAEVFDANGLSKSAEIITLVDDVSGKHVNVENEFLADSGFALMWSVTTWETNHHQVFVQSFDNEGIARHAPITLFEGLSWPSFEITSIGQNGDYAITGSVFENGLTSYTGQLVSANGSTKTLYESSLYSHFELTPVGSEGAFVIVSRQFESMNGLSVQLYDSAGVPVGTTVMLSNTQHGNVNSPSIIDMGNGEYAVTWKSDTYENGVWAGSYVFIEQFNADGTLADKTTIDTNGEVAVTSNEDGMAYLVNSSLFGDNFLSDEEQWESGLFDALSNDNSAQWNSTEVTAGVSTSVPADGLVPGTYYLLISDLAGNVNVSDVAITVNEAEPPTEVLFDLTTGVSTDLDGRVFSADETYDIYINVGDGSGLTFTIDQQWSSAENLGDDDTIILVSNDNVTEILTGEDITWTFADESKAVLTDEGEFSIGVDNAVDLWDGARVMLVQVNDELTDGF